MKQRRCSVAEQGQKAAVEYLTAEEVSEKLRVAYVTVLKWMKHGYRGRKLRAIRAGSQYRTTQAWVDEHVDYMTKQAEQGDTEDRLATDRGESSADRELAKLGM